MMSSSSIFLFERRGIGKWVNWFGLFRVYLMGEDVTLRRSFEL